MDSGLHATVLAGLAEGVVVVDPHGRLIQANAAAASILALELPPPPGAGAWWESFSARRTSDGSRLDVGRRVLASGEAVYDVEVEVELGGEAKTLVLNYIPLGGRAGSASGLVVSFRDVTVDTRRRAELLETEDRLREAHAVARLASWEWRPLTGEVLVFEAIGQEMTPGTVLSLDEWLALVSVEEHEGVHADFEGFLAGERDSAVRRFRHVLGGKAVWLEIRSRAVRGDQGELLCVRGTAQDVSEQEAAREDIANSERVLSRAHDHLRAVTDSMTDGLFTLDGNGCVDYMNQAAVDLLGWPLAAICGKPLDPTIHDPETRRATTAGGDSRILQALRGEVVRVDDDVFACFDGGELPVSFTASPLTSDREGEGCVVVFADITERKAGERVVADDLEKLACAGRIEEALTNDGFVLHAQPILDLRTGTVVQQELLIRMRPSGAVGDADLIPPGDFLPVAEEFGLITRIDRWVIDRATELAAGGVAVELNISGRSIDDPMLVDYIEDAIDRAGADPRSLVFELTETTMIASEAAAREFVERLHLIGCKLALDDFGTGYGGFTYVKHLPIDFLKIDVEFIGDLRRSSASRKVVQAIVRLARGFGLETVAEGVEDEETLETVRELGVSRAQGFHIGRPAPPAARRRSPS